MRKPDKRVEVLNKTAQTFGGLRETLFNELDRLRNGLSDPTNANATARLASEITKTVTAELKILEMQLKLPQPQKANVTELNKALGSHDSNAA